MIKRYFPLVGVLSSVILFIVAAAYYPGGTLESADTVGYDWTRHFISTLFAPKSLNGAANPSRDFAIPAALIICISLAVIFKGVSLKTPSKAMRSTIEIGGIGSMVYAFLAVATPMHDVLVTVGLVFFLVAVLATLQVLYTAGQTKLVFFGMSSLALKLVSAVIYYGNVFFVVLPVVQKLAFIVSVGWLLAVHFADFDPRRTGGT